MEAITNLLSWRHIAATAAFYFASLAFYRLFLHPLARFPGPWLAAITRYYEAYFDVSQNGQYTFQIAEMHKNYGPIVRISPYELHVSDPSFHEKLFRQEGRWDKYAWVVDAFSVKGATICTPGHDVHKARRQPWSPLFSKARVASQQDILHLNLSKLCKRISGFCDGSKSTIDLGAAISAFTRDVATDFILGRGYHDLDHEDFNAGMTGAIQSTGFIQRTTKHIPWFGPFLNSIPHSWIMKVADDGTKAWFTYIKDSAKDVQAVLAEAASSSPKESDSRTIVHEILASNHLPPSEKTFERVFEDVMAATGAGFETTAAVLRLVSYHVFSNPEILQRLRRELCRVISGLQPVEKMELRDLEKLPYLTSVLMEGLRLSPGLATRQSRIAPDRELQYGNRRIPAGTPVIMTTLFMHTDEKLYPDPMRFDPERWMEPDARKKADKTFAPFSKGTRICVGMHLAWAEMYMALVQQFEFKFEGIDETYFECESDQFIMGTKGKGVLEAHASLHQD